MNLLDAALGLLLLAAAVGGWRLGLVSRVLSWIGMFVGLAVAVVLLRVAVEPLANLGSLAVVALSVGALLAGSFIGQGLGLWAGAALRRHHVAPRGVAARLDGPAGAAVGMAGVLALLWLLVPVLAGLSGTPGRLVRDSALVQALDARLPDPPDAVQSLRTFVGGGAFPQVFESLGPTPPAGPPPASAGLDQPLVDRVAASVVRVEGTACNRLQHGTGWVAGEDLVVTNAHVVAGESTTEVVRDDGRFLPALVVAFDPAQDLAVLSVPGLERPPLGRSGAVVGATGGVFGHPGGGDLRLAPASVSREIEAVGRDIYGRAGARRQVLELATRLAPGDSGAPLVTPAGEVVGVVFAVATDRSDVAYALTTAEVDAVLADVSGPVSAGGCVG
jgi:hypothetical protein